LGNKITDDLYFGVIRNETITEAIAAKMVTKIIGHLCL
jgi:hypothetical protein